MVVVVLYPIRMRNWVLNVLMTFIINPPFPFTSKDISFLTPNFFSVQCSVCCFTSYHRKEQFEKKKKRKKERNKSPYTVKSDKAAVAEWGHLRFRNSVSVFRFLQCCHYMRSIKKIFYLLLHYFFVILPREKSVKQKSISTSGERYFLSILPAKEINRKTKI